MMRNLFKKKPKEQTLVISLNKMNAAGEFDHVNCWARKWNLQYTDYKCINGVWYFYNVTNLPAELPAWAEVV